MPPKTKKTVDQKYVMMDQIEHILNLPDSYVGSIEKSDFELNVFNKENGRMEKKVLQICPALYKIFDEIIVNAYDQFVRTTQDVVGDENVKPVTTIKVVIDKENNEISVYNDGDGIECEEHGEHKMYIPEMIFGNLLTSANYDKNEQKTTGGKNGYGAKLANIFSTEFSVETVDAIRKKKYIQKWTNNMSEKTKPKLTKCSTAKPYTMIKFKPDLAKFGMTELEDDIIALMEKRVYDMTACTDKSVNVYLNGTRLLCKEFEKYVDYYIGNKQTKSRVYEKLNDWWEIAVCESDDNSMEHVSFVNGIYTFKGGKHVDHIANHISKKLQAFMTAKGKKKKVELKQNHIKDNMCIFIKSTIVNPSFDSQTKECLTTVYKNFGSKVDVSEKFIEKLSKTGIVEKAMKLGAFKESTTLTKTDGKKKNVIKGIPKLDDANWAGTAKSGECTLILTEGDSAKAFAIAGLSKTGRDRFGVFPLKGKLLNVRDCSDKKASENQEITNIKTIMGLQQKKNYKNDISDLRYGRIMILTDQDVDGSHIKGLFMNFINSYWNTLTQIPGFIVSLATPIVKARYKKEVKTFYTLSEYEEWEKSVDIKKWEIKYYKGLGTSTSSEAKECFEDLEMKKINYTWDKEHCQNKIDMAFAKKNSDMRKEWLKSYDKEDVITQDQKEVLYSDFIDKDLIHFSNYDNTRSLPSMCDGLKPSQRKVLFSVLKRNLKKGIKVAQLTGYVSEHACYHHGEMSLNETIIGMAQDYMGSNNINLLYPDGQFGTRLQGGKDAGAPRYIWTYMSKITSVLFNSDDNAVLKYNEEEGLNIEPEWYMPILPLVLINGGEGIGTGFSTKIPSHNPLDIIANIKLLMADKEPIAVKPWFRGFKGSVANISEDEVKYASNGIYKRTNDKTIVITELPIGSWTDDYKAYLEDLIFDKSAEEKKKKKQCIQSYNTECSEATIKLTIKFLKADLDKLVNDGTLESVLKLSETRNCSYSNMHLYGADGRIKKYNNVNEILNEFYIIRLEYYLKRKEYMLAKYKRELDIYEAKIRFITEFITGTIKLINEEDDVIEADLVAKNYPKFSTGEEVSVSYDYLINMQIRSLTKKKIEELKKLHETKLGVYNELQNKTEKDLWSEDLNQFEKVYKEEMKEYEKRYK